MTSFLKLDLERSWAAIPGVKSVLSSLNLLEVAQILAQAERTMK
jgi:hypothetical protein